MRVKKWKYLLGFWRLRNKTTQATAGTEQRRAGSLPEKGDEYLITTMLVKP